jgi:protoporphyrinogen oxidase
MLPGTSERLSQAPADGEAYRFEIGGGHWIFGGDPSVLHFIRTLTQVKSYRRRSAVYFRDRNLYVSYPLQNHLRFLGCEIAIQAITEMARPQGSFQTMREWLERSFGPTLCQKFFFPFHDLYTAGLYTRIVPQDAYKSPVNLSLAIRGAFDEAPAVGYNVTFVYPVEGLNILVERMGSHCDVRYGKSAVKIDVQGQEVHFADGSVVPYNTLICTLPLSKMLEMTGLVVDANPDPYTSVLVLNIGAARGGHCPDEHWLYIPDSISGFHRVGFYSNVDRSFLPASMRESGDRVSIYVERAYMSGERPSEAEEAQYAEAVIRELQEWDFIGDVEVVDPTWIDVAYTWAWPGSRWNSAVLNELEKANIHQAGRYGCWAFQGIADSIRDGFVIGSAFK